MNLTKLQLVHCFSLGMAKNCSCMRVCVDPLPSCHGLLWGFCRPDMPPLWSPSRRRQDRPTWMTGERSQRVLLAMDLCLTQQRRRWKRTGPSGHHPAWLRICQMLLPSDVSCRAVALNLGRMIESPREPQLFLWPGLQPRLIKSISRCVGACTGIYESSPDGSNVRPRGEALLQGDSNNMWAWAQLVRGCSRGTCKTPLA